MTEKNMLTIAIHEGMERYDGCLLCYLWLKSEERYMDYLLTNEATMSPEFREKVLVNKGFCNRHMHLLYKTAYGGHTEDGLGYSLYMQGVVRRISEELGPLLHRLRSLEDSKKSILARRRKRRGQVLSLLCNDVEHVIQGQRQCPACEHLLSLDKIHMHTLVQMLDDKDFRGEFKTSQGLCLPHFASTIHMLSQSKLRNPSKIVQTLIEVEIKRLQLVDQCLLEFARKRRWEFRNEPLGIEVNANSMVLNILVGAEGLYCRS